MARIPVTVQGSSPRASGELTMPFILPDALTKDRPVLGVTRHVHGASVTADSGSWPACP
jgi:hypothetical protein